MLRLPININIEAEEINFQGENTEELLNQTYTEINDERPSGSEQEQENNGLIADLALILLLGAVVTLLFKRLKQPVVLGYILAGFLASPKFTYIPSISNLENIEFWADLGIVILMFTLGLEFSFRKLMNAGSSAVMTALIIITGMTFAGFGVGKILHLNSINCIFLGGMISMSSTTIILKTLTDLGMRQKKFASLVLAVLIIEDLFAVLMLVLLSSIAVGNVEGSELLFSIGKLLFFLIIWFLVGVFVLPSFLTKVKGFLNDETMLVVAMGLCFSMAVFSVVCGFSLELGAFVMGSILAGTMFAERMEKVVKPVKDLFGAVFFISVGMMVDPSVLVSYWWEILILAAVVIVGMIFFGTLGMLTTGQSLRVAIESGFTLTQVGEFSFIIASLGMSLGVLQESLYPIIVAVSVITIFTTPYFVKMSQPAYKFVESKLPENLRFLIDRYSKQVVDKNSDRKLWKDILSRYLGRMVIFSVILIAIILVSRQFLFPLLEAYMHDWGRFLATVITLGAMMPFLFALSFSTLKENERMRLHNSASFYSVPLVALRIIRYLVALLFIVYLLTLAYDATVAWIAGIICLAAIITFASQKISARYTTIEKKFIDNLNIRENTKSGANNHVIDDLHLAYIEVGSYCPFVGDKLKDSGLRSDYGVSIASIQRGERLMPLPSFDARIFPGDVLGVIGTDEQIKRLNDDIERDEKAYRALDVYTSKVDIGSITLSETSPVANKSLGETNILKDFYCMVVKVQRGEDVFEQPGPDTVLRPGDIVWLVGDPNKMEEMK
ncbi:MAG: cation:proton antiporter [Muribaculaceae bacterium]|nr:cation:proton antiporter [Muribaculaceae bacterium]